MVVQKLNALYQIVQTSQLRKKVLQDIKLISDTKTILIENQSIIYVIDDSEFDSIDDDLGCKIINTLNIKDIGYNITGTRYTPFN